MPSTQLNYDLFVMKTDSNGICITSISYPGNENVSRDFEVYNYPNPFNPTTTIHYYLPNSEQVVLKIFTITGQDIRTLINQPQTAGEHLVAWDGTDNNNNLVGSGVYIYQFKAGNQMKSRKMLLIR